MLVRWELWVFSSLWRERGIRGMERGRESVRGGEEGVKKRDGGADMFSYRVNIHSI